MSAYIDDFTLDLGIDRPHVRAMRTEGSDRTRSAHAKRKARTRRAERAFKLAVTR